MLLLVWSQSKSGRHTYCQMLKPKSVIIPHIFFICFVYSWFHPSFCFSIVAFSSVFSWHSPLCLWIIKWKSAQYKAKYWLNPNVWFEFFLKTFVFIRSLHTANIMKGKQAMLFCRITCPKQMPALNGCLYIIM